MSSQEPAQLQGIYRRRFEKSLDYRRQVWSILVPAFFQKWVEASDTVLDLGCGYGEFINAVRARERLAMDLNPDTASYLDPSTKFLAQDCSQRWQVDSGSLNVVFSSNFFEHLPAKQKLEATFAEAHRCLAAGGKLIAMGPNIRYLPGKYWDFWDHHLALTDLSLAEGLVSAGFEISHRIARFLPYTMVNQPIYPPGLLKLYLRLPILWRLFGRQFLIIANKPSAA